MSKRAFVCPRCAVRDYVRESRAQRIDFIPRLVGMKAYRCDMCRHRYHSWKPLVPPAEERGMGERGTGERGTGQRA